MTAVRTGLLRQLLETVIPRDCGGCGAPGDGLCAACERDLLELLPELQPGGVWAATDTRGIGRSLVRSLKQRQERAAVPVLGALLARSITGALWVTSAGVSAGHAADAGLVLVPVPARREALQQRGMDCTGTVAAAAARQLRCHWAGRVAVIHAARWRRQPADQRGLAAGERAVNVAGALSADDRRIGAGALVVAVDDVVTTGSSLRELVRALTAAGVDPHGAAAAVATPASDPQGMQRPGRVRWG